MAGFITSLIGVLTCGVISPIGLLLSLIGLTKRPRGFAAAGAVLGVVGTIFLIAMGFGIVAGFLGLKKGLETIAEYEGVRQNAAQPAYDAIDKQRQANDALPADAEGNRLVQTYKDTWGTPLKYERVGETFALVSAGKDTKFGTEDDLRFDESNLRAHSATGPTTDEAEMTGEEEMTEEDAGTGDAGDAATDDTATEGENP
jgi:hypothetical protein